MSSTPGWYPDPSGDTSKLRYWDGTQWTDNYTAAPNQSSVATPASTFPTSENDKTLRLIAFVFNVLSCVGFGALLIPLAWMIPMTVHSYGIYKGTKPNTVAFGVCSIIFLNLVSGILLLISTKDQ